MSDPARSDRASKRSSGQAKTTTTAASTKNAGTKRADQRTESAEADNTDADSIHSRHALQVFKSNKSANGSQSDISMVLDQHRQSNGGGGDVEESLDDEARAARDSAKAAEEASFRTFRNRTLLKAGLNFGALFVVCALLCFLTLWFVLPPIDEEDRSRLKIPRSFEQLKALNAVLQGYKDEYFARVMFCWIVIYMFLQAFSVPGSMYMSIIAGAMWGVPLALPIVCASVATGATICYLISQQLGAVLVAMPKWKARVDAWGEVLARHNDNMLSYLIVIRMMPLPPHNVVNILAPHLGIRIGLFWISTFFGIFAVSTIHVTIGEKLDQMTSADDFHIISVRNFFLLAGVCIAVMIPVFVKRYSAVASEGLEEAEGSGAVRLPGPEGERSRPRGRRSGEEGDDSLEDEDEEHEDELPRVNLRGASRTGAYRDEDDDDEGQDEEGRRAAYVARAWRGVEMDADANAYDDDDLDNGGHSPSSPHLSGFEDRREEQLSGRRRSTKAHRVLGIRGNGSGNYQAQNNEQSYLDRLSGWVGGAFGGGRR